MDGTTVKDLPRSYSYNLELPYGTSAVPAITATADNNASVVVTLAALPGATTIIVTARRSYYKTYTVNSQWQQHPICDATLSDLKMDEQ